MRKQYDNSKSLLENAINGVDITEPDCPEDRCPICWEDGIDSLKEDGGDYCQYHREEMQYEC